MAHRRDRPDNNRQRHLLPRDLLSDYDVGQGPGRDMPMRMDSHFIGKAICRVGIEIVPGSDILSDDIRPTKLRQISRRVEATASAGHDRPGSRGNQWLEIEALRAWETWGRNGTGSSTYVVGQPTLRKDG